MERKRQSLGIRIRDPKKVAEEERFPFLLAAGGIVLLLGQIVFLMLELLNISIFIR